jgi:hypothetical protein
MDSGSVAQPFDPRAFTLQDVEKPWRLKVPHKMNGFRRVKYTDPPYPLDSPVDEDGMVLLMLYTRITANLAVAFIHSQHQYKVVTVLDHMVVKAVNVNPNRESLKDFRWPFRLDEHTLHRIGADADEHDFTLGMRIAKRVIAELIEREPARRRVGEQDEVWLRGQLENLRDRPE